MDKYVISSGKKLFAPSAFEDINNIKDQYLNKPYGGLYASSIIKDSNKKYSSYWIDFCVTNDFVADTTGYGLIFKFKKSANILTINSIEDYYELIGEYNLAKEGRKYFIDFERLSKNFDVIYFTQRVVNELDNGVLYWYDVDTYIIMNYHSIDFTSLKHFNSKEELNSICKDLKIVV